MPPPQSEVPGEVLGAKKNIKNWFSQKGLILWFIQDLQHVTPMVLEHPALEFLLVINFKNFAYKEGCMKDIGDCYTVAPPLILLPKYSKLWKMTLWRLLGSKWNLDTASNILSSTFSHGLMSVENIGGCISMAPPLILLPNYSKLVKMSLWRHLRSKWNLWYGLWHIGIHFWPWIDVSGGQWRLLFSGPTLIIAFKLL